MLAVFCRECREKLYELSDIDEDRQSVCPNCGSIYKFYHLTHRPSGNSIDAGTYTGELLDNKTSRVKI